MEKRTAASPRRALRAQTPIVILISLVLLGAPLIAARGQSNGGGSSSSPQETSPAKSQAAATTTAAQKASKVPGEMQKALQEFRLQAGQIGSAAGKGLGDRQNALTGRIFEYVRNDILDAVPHEVKQRGGDKSLLRRNQFGFTLSGPVVAPFLYNGRGRTFFSASYEGTRERIARSQLFTLPTDKQRGGDFSDLVDLAGAPVIIYDPATTRPNPAYDPRQPVSAENTQYLRDPFPGNRIPVDRLDPVARALVALYPRPNTSVGPFLQNNYWINSPFANRADGGIVRLDHTLTSKQRLNLNLTLSRGTRKAPEYYPGPADAGDPSYFYDSRSVTLVDTYTASPQTVWEFRLAGSSNLTRSLEFDASDGEDYPRALGLRGLFAKSFPNFRFGTYLPLGPPPTAQFRDANYAGSAQAGVSLNRRAHTVRLSAIARRSFANSYNPWAPAGFFSFGNALTALPGVKNTGNAFAQFLLGLTSRAEESIVIHPSYFRKNFFELTARDEYRVRTGLTVNFGLSLEVATPRIEKYDRQSTVSFDRLNTANNRPGALVFAGRDGQGRGLQPATARLEPSIGLAVNPWNDRRTVLRLGYSLSYDDYPLVGRGFGTQGFNASPLFTSSNDQLEPSFLLRDGMPQNFPAPPFLDPTAANNTDADYLDASGILPAEHQWHATLQRELVRSLSVEVEYNGFRGTHLFTGGLARLNAVPVEYLAFGDKLYDDAFRNSLRPYPQYRNLELGGVYPGGDAYGHAMTVTVDKRLSGGLYGRASYRLSKQIDNVSSPGAQNPHDWRAERALSPYDVTHTLNVSYTYELPLGKGKTFFGEGGWIDRFVGGWSVSGLTTVRGGTPLQLRPLFNRTGGIIPSLRVNAVAGISPEVERASPEQWFNPAAFTQPDDFTLGNMSRTHPSLRGPGEQFHHLSLTKRVPLSGEKTLELVAEAFNFVNHANWNDPDTRIGTSENPNLNAGKIIGSSGGRVMQLGMRILF